MALEITKMAKMLTMTGILGGDGLFNDAHGKDDGKDGYHDEAEHVVCWTMMSTMTTKLTAMIMTQIMITMLIALRTLLTMTMPMV